MIDEYIEIENIVTAVIKYICSQHYESFISESRVSIKYSSKHSVNLIKSITFQFISNKIGKIRCSFEKIRLHKTLDTVADQDAVEIFKTSENNTDSLKPDILNYYPSKADFKLWKKHFDLFCFAKLNRLLFEFITILIPANSKQYGYTVQNKYGYKTTINKLSEYVIGIFPTKFRITPSLKYWNQSPFQREYIT